MALSPIPTFEVAAWIVFACALAAAVVPMIRTAPARELRFIGALLVVAVAARLLVPFGPTNWYAGVENLGLGPDVYTRSSTYVPLPNRLVIFDWELGSLGIRALNLTLGTLSVALLSFAAIRAGYSARVCRVFAVLLGFAPMFVRFSASDASHTMVLFLYACAAAAYVDFERDRQRIAAPLLLFASIVLALPIRLESAFLFLSVPFFTFRGGTRLRSALWRGIPTLVVLVAAAIGAASVIAFHGDAIRDRAQLDLFGIGLTAASRILAVVNPHYIAFFPAIIAVPIWIYAATLLRRRAWNELASIYVPILFCGIPFVFVGGVFMDLPSAGYNIISVPFIALAAARGVDFVWTKATGWSAGARRALAGIAVAVTATSFAPGYVHTYAYQEEYGFLRNALPEEPATVLVIWDPETDAGDFDCCLAMPYPMLLAEFPDLTWTVLRRADLERRDYEGLAFDYYYPGSMASIDINSLGSRYAKMVVPSERDRRRQREHLRDIQALDQAIRGTYHLERAESATIRANTFSSVAFRDDEVELVLYRTAR